MKLLSLLFGLLASFGIGELFCQRVIPAQFHRDIFVDERNTFFRHDAYFGWLPIPKVEGDFERSTPIHVKHNSEGFRDREPTATDKPTLLFVGDSLTWGFDANAEDRFTDLLVPRLPEWNIRNMGVSGFGTDQELLLLKRVGAHFHPRHVFLVYCWNDREDNTSNLNFGNYYKPYFVLEHGKLALKGVPVPRSLNFAHELGPFRWSALVRFLFFNVWFERDRVDIPDITLRLVAEMRRFVHDELHAAFSIGLAGPDAEISRWCADRGVPCLDLDTRLKFPGFGTHWTPAGHRVIAARIADYFRTGKRGR